MSATSPTSPDGLLTHIADIRRLGTRVVGQRARITGVVTFFDPGWDLLFVQGDDAGIFVFMRGVESTVKVGDLVQVDGKVDPGDFAPSITEPHVVTIGRGALPQPLTPNAEVMATGHVDSQYVEVEGVIHGFRPINDDHLRFDVMAGALHVLVTLPAPWRGNVPTHLVDARVRLRGVCGTEFNPRRQLIGVQLFLSSFADARVVDPAPVDPYAAPVREIENLFSWSSLSAPGRRVHVRGEITWRNGSQLYVRDQRGSIALTLWDASAPGQPGDTVDVVGFPQPGSYNPVLEDAVMQVHSAHSAAVRAQAVTAAELADGSQDGNLVTVDALLLNTTGGSQPALALRVGDVLVRGVLPVTDQGPDAAWLPEPGSRVRVTGVCRVSVNPLDNPRVPRGEELLLRGPGDIVVLQAPAWWTSPRATEILSGLALMTLGALGWIFALRRRVAQQTGEIVQRAAHEEALVAQYQELFENANDVVLTCRNDGRLAAINPAGERATGYPRPVAIGTSLASLVAETDRERFLSRFAECLANPEGDTFEVTLVRPNGERVAIEFDAHPISEHGQVTGVHAIGRDVTERNRTAFELERAKTAAEAASRAKSEFVANISHEVRTPLNGIIGMTELLLASKIGGDERQYLGLIRTSADALLHVINDVLDLSKIESGHLELTPRPFDPLARLETIVEPLAVMARRKGLTFTSAVAPELPPVVIGDADRVGQVLTNLIGNAIKFTDAGEVRIGVTQALPEPGDGATACRLRFTVSDSGIGIPAAQHATIFEAFTQADGSISRRFGGTGLGLAIAASLVRRMGGAIALESAPDQGSTFIVTLPFTRGERASLEADDPAASLARLLGPAARGTGWASHKAAQSLAVLLVEDNFVNQRLTAEILARRGHQVVVAENGRQALDRFTAAVPDVILMDVQMPEMNGLEATRAIRELEQGTGRHVPIVAMTAHAMSGDRERCLAAGMDEYMTKPIRAEALVTQVERLGMSARDEAATPTDDVPPFDRAAALDRVDGDRGLLAEIAGIFLSDIPAMLESVKAAQTAGDPAALTRAAHRVKGSVLTFAAGPSSDAALALEQLGRTGEMAGADRLVRTLELELDRLASALKPLLHQDVGD
jgi:PAS domain S-box-containing protein